MATMLEQLRTDMNEEAKRLRGKADMVRESFHTVSTTSLPTVALLARTFESAAAVFEDAMFKVEERMRDEGKKHWSGRATQRLDETLDGVAPGPKLLSKESA
jgi:hypothetical protein